MPPYDLEFFRRQPVRLLENRIRHADLANVVERAGFHQRLDIFVREDFGIGGIAPQFECQRATIKGNSLEVFACVRVALFRQFCDLLHDFFKMPHEEERKALVRLEDVSVDDEIDDLRNVADYLYERHVPFQISLIPIFKDPDNDLEIYLSDRPAFVRAITEPGMLADTSGYSPDLTFAHKVELLETLDVVERLCDEVAIIDRGRIVAQGTLDEIRAQRALGGGASLEDVFLKLVDADVRREDLSWIG